MLRAMRRRFSVRVRRLGLLFLAGGLLAAGDYFAYPRWAGVGGRSFDRGANGLWLRYTWYFGQHSDADVARLAGDLRARHLRYAYFHVRSITGEGKLAYRYPENARRLTAALRRQAPEVKAVPWIYAGNPAGLGKVNLADAEVRRAMAGEAAWLVRECGFDGVQWDYEICPDGDAGFLALMRETRAALPAGALLSAAVPMWLPPPFRRWGWSEGYFAEVAATSDQMAVMCYDSGVLLPRGYVWLVRQQAIRVPRAARRGSPHCRVLLGLPTYGDAGLSHNPRAENLRLGLKGVREGLAGADTSAFEGVAVFADYTTTPADWRTYQELWLLSASVGTRPSAAPGRR